MKAQKPAAIAQFVAQAFRRYGMGLHRYLERRLSSPQDADDLTQEVYLRLLRLEDTEFVRKPQAYLYGVASNVVREYRMRSDLERERMSFDSDLMQDETDHPHELQADDLADRLHTVRQLEKALDQLPPMHRAIIVLLKRDGLTYEEAAQATGLSWWTVEKYYHQAKAQLKTMKWER
jgi:RNA polymerase sigma-70 factor (ECF subfamily)